jgi:glycosyltransferase involved in cell wall biosynthesis
MKKILIFSLTYYSYNPPHIGGDEVAVKEITDRIDPKEIEFHLICNRFDSNLPVVEKLGNVTVYRIGFGKKGADSVATHRPLFYLWKILFVPLAALEAVSLHRRHHFDGFWAMMVYMTFPVVLARAFGARVPYILTLQEGDPFEHVFERLRIRLLRPLLQYGVRNAVVVQSISSFLGGWATQMGFVGRVEVIPNGVDVAHFSRTVSSEVLTKTRAELVNTEGDIVLIHTGRMVLKNGLSDIIRALACLPTNVSFVQIGKGPDKEKLWKLAGECRVADRVYFGGFIDHKDLPRYLQASDIFIRPSLSEGMGNSFIEAMAAGVPVIGTQEGGITDFLFDSELTPDKKPTGRAVKPNDPEAIARAVMLYLKDTDTTRRIVENARAMVVEKYDWSRIVADMRERVFSRILSV